MYLIFKTLFLQFTLISLSVAAIVEYDLTVDYKTVNFTGKNTRAMAVNDNIPAPTLYFKKGDVARIAITNTMDQDTSVHWHGILLPNHQDGVPFVNHPPIKPGDTHLFEFETTHTGTYWYHSHTGLQEQLGIYGAIVIAPESGVQTPTADKEHVVILSDWINTHPDEVLRTLKSGSDYYSIKKDSNQNLLSAIKNDGLIQSLKQSWQRMPGMDISDVAYDQFLANGKPAITIAAEVNSTIKLRFVNAAASSYFNLQFAGGDMKIVAADGNEVKPVKVNQFLMAVAETYDVIVNIPRQGLFELRASAQDGSGYTSIWLGSGEQKIFAKDQAKPKPYQMQMSMPMPMDKPGEHAGHHAMHSMSSQQTSQTPYASLRAVNATTLPTNNKPREITLNLTGDMERYTWSINNKILAADNSIKIKRGENIRFILNNQTMMHHPMHLHGHFFRVITDQGDYSPLKHTVDVPPMGQQIIEFEANEHHDWFFHCHILYHAKSGMARIVSYQEDQVDPEISSIRHKLYTDNAYFYASASLLSQMTDGLAVFSNSKNSLRTEWEVGWQNVPKVDYDIDISYERSINRFLSGFTGINIVNDDQRGIFGIRYLLPFNIDSEWRIDTSAELRLTLGKNIQLTNNIDIFGEFEYDTGSQEEWVAGINYSWLKNFAVVTQYHSEFGIGAGIKFVY